MDPQAFINQSIEGLRVQTAAHSGMWNFGQEENWTVDQDAGVIQFSFADGTLVEAPVQIVGTYSTEDGTFLWGWDHPSVEEPLQEHAWLAKKWGDENNLEAYANQEAVCTQDEAWEFTAVTARLANANGAYRGPAGPTLVYMTFGELTITKT